MAGVSDSPWRASRPMGRPPTHRRAGLSPRRRVSHVISAIDAAAKVLADVAKSYGRTVHGIAPAALERMRRYDWPGNIRELAHFAERVALSLDDTIRPPDEGLSLPDRVNRFEGELLRDALQSHRGDISAVLGEMQVPRKTLYDKLQRHGLKPADFR